MALHALDHPSSAITPLSLSPLPPIPTRRTNLTMLPLLCPPFDPKTSLALHIHHPEPRPRLAPLVPQLRIRALGWPRPTIDAEPQLAFIPVPPPPPLAEVIRKLARAAQPHADGADEDVELACGVRLLGDEQRGEIWGRDEGAEVRAGLAEVEGAWEGEVGYYFEVELGGEGEQGGLWGCGEGEAAQG